MRIAICDDEPKTRILISEMIRSNFKEMDLVIRLFESGENLVQVIKTGKKDFDLIFLDIEMPGLDGIQIAKQLQQNKENTKFVFITSHDEYALMGYEVSAFRFIKKPIQQVKVLEAIAAIAKEEKTHRKITIEFNGEISVVYLNKILYVEAQKQNIKIVTLNHTFYERETLSNFKSRLINEDFYISHRSYLVNLAFVSGIGEAIYLVNGETIPLSRNRKKSFKTALTDYVHKVVR